jgi:flagellar hook-associated protein 1 FlgK
LLVSGDSTFQLTSGTVGGVTDFFVGSTDVTSQLATGGGELGGYLTARDQDIPGALASMDQLAYNISTAVNTQNSAGTDLDGVTGTVAAPLNIFSQPTAVAGSAMSMSVAMTDPNQIAAAGAGQATGANSNATLMANMANQTIVGGQTPIDFYSSFVSTLGATVSGVQAESTAQNASVTQLQSQNNALSGVNLNDEAAAMSKLQTSYQAASQVFAILNKIMTSALNLGQETAVS